MKTECQRHPGMCASDPFCADHYCPGHPRNTSYFNRNGGGSYEHGLPITFEGDEPETPTPWELIWADAHWVLLALAFFCALMIAAGYYGA